jgi:hypothetical protein
MNLRSVDIATKNALAAFYSTAGSLVLQDVALPPAFDPGTTDVVFLAVGGHCEVYIDARVVYAGPDRSWQAITRRTEAPGHARLVTTCPDFFSALRTLAHLLAIRDQSNTAPPERQHRQAWLQKLGLSGNPTLDQIKKAYRRLAMMYHPDRLVGAPVAQIKSAEERFKGIAEAHHALLNLR